MPAWRSCMALDKLGDPFGYNNRWIAALDHLGPHGVPWGQHSQVAEIPVVAVHTQVVPADDNIGSQNRGWPRGWGHGLSGCGCYRWSNGGRQGREKKVTKLMVGCSAAQHKLSDKIMAVAIILLAIDAVQESGAKLLMQMCGGADDPDSAG